MTRRERLIAQDIQGPWATMMPSKPESSDWLSTHTVDLDETSRVAEALVQSGVNGILSLGSFGEGATLNAAALGLFTKGEFAEFSKFNIGLEKRRRKCPAAGAPGWMPSLTSAG